ncbi:amidohydrolase family protein [Pseudoduganella namucuonensis]|uniref:L-fuconolactonase n=1 Tax=Pseudoduganella namucuonensis TaxID=1035707 RepID=A0A1I7K005_9BURK|nr:amidohydrolase family protein [Pseudoduganella namucuonensis]SFU90701.1 L-fuconolactonase [Pseudoduganella namucuonensis]
MSTSSTAPRIDAHQHFWRIADRGGAWPPPELAELHRDFLPDQLEPALARHGVAGTVLVQSLPSEADTLFMLDLARRHSFIAAVVGWVDLKRADAAARIGALAADPKLRGLRPMLQDLDDERWIDDPALAPAVEAMLRHGLVFDALVLPRHLPALLAFARRYPDLPVVIDHGAKPAIAQGAAEPWRTDLARLAALPRVHCKLSGLVTESGADWTVPRLQPYVDHILGVFGARRVIWGSDWPVLNLASTYAGWVAASDALLAGLDEAQRRDIFGGNAQRFYRLA